MGFNFCDNLVLRFPKLGGNNSFELNPNSDGISGFLGSGGVISSQEKKLILLKIQNNDSVSMAACSQAPYLERKCEALK
jgi:hypothetical protein